MPSAPRTLSEIRTHFSAFQMVYFTRETTWLMVLFLSGFFFFFGLSRRLFFGNGMACLPVRCTLVLEMRFGLHEISNLRIGNKDGSHYFSVVSTEELPRQFRFHKPKPGHVDPTDHACARFVVLKEGGYGNQQSLIKVVAQRANHNYLGLYCSKEVSLCVLARPAGRA